MTHSHRITRLAAAIVLAAGSLALAPQAQATLKVAKATTQSSHDVKDALVQINEMATQVQRITTSLLLNGLNIKPEANLARAQKSLAFVDRMVHVVRHGDPAMKLPAVENAKQIANVEAVEQQWAELRPLLARSIKAKQLSAEDLQLIAQHDLSMVKVILEMEQEFVRLFGQSSLASMLVFTAQQSERLTFLVEELSSDMLLIAYGHDIAGSRQRLTRNQEIFQATLTGLIKGNPEKRIIPAPNPRIRAQLGKVQLLWDDVRPILKASAGGGSPSIENLRTVLPLIQSLYEQMEIAVAYYDEL